MRIYKLLSNFPVKLITTIISTELNHLKQMNSFLGIYEPLLEMMIHLPRISVKFLVNTSIGTSICLLLESLI